MRVASPLFQLSVLRPGLHHCLVLQQSNALRTHLGRFIVSLLHRLSLLLLESHIVLGHIEASLLFLLLLALLLH